MSSTKLESPQHKRSDSAKSETELFDHSHAFPDIVSNNREIKDILKLLLKVAPSNSPILILGETGTGKELIAKAIHKNSNRPKDKFVTINCSAIPENLFESELFGYVKGAFTGAEKSTPGILESTQGGTLFLDEIGDMPLHLQVKLLRVLQEKKYTPVGSRVELKTDIRFIAATNKNLEEEIREKKFRLDLYYRLNVLPIRIPPLRQRREDIPLLFFYFSKLFLTKNHKSLQFTLDKELSELLHNYHWPGNIRELYNLAERLCLIKENNFISINDLPDEMKEAMLASKNNQTIDENEDHYGQIIKFKIPESGFDLDKLLEEIGNYYIKEALVKTGNNKKKAAELLKLNRTTLLERLKRKSFA